MSLDYFTYDGFVVDGIRYDSGGPGVGWTRLMFELAYEHNCNKSCFFDSGCDERDSRCKATGLPAEFSGSHAFRWRPGDPVYIGGVS